MTTYYVDNAGSDSNSGLVGHPWQTLAHAFAQAFSAGDGLVLTPGQSFASTTTPWSTSGTAGNYCCIGTGRGTTPVRVAQSNPATITVADGVAIALAIDDVEYFWLDNIVIQGSGVDIATGVTTGTAAGISFKSTQTTNKLRSNRITACTIEGTQHGMIAWTAANTNVGFDDLQVWGCDLHAIQGWCINVPVNYNLETGSNNPTTGSKTQNTDVYIGHTQVYDSPGYSLGPEQGGGCWVNNCTGGIVEYCVVHDIQNGTGTGRGRNDEFGSPGFIAIMCDGITFQYSEAYNCRSNLADFDGEGFDAEPSSTNIVFQYNYAHDNDGCGFLTGGQTTRFNVSANNNKNKNAITGTLGTINVNNWLIYGEFVHLGHDGVDAYFYGNTAVANNGGTPLLGADGSGSTVTHAYNNIFAAANASILAVNVWKLDAVGNLYYYPGTPGLAAVHTQSPDVLYATLSDLHTAGYEKNAGIDYGVVGNPLLLNPTVTPAALPANPVATITNFDIPNNSPAVSEGIDFSLLSINPGTVDFHNVPVLFRNAGSQQQELAVWHIAQARLAA